jgi:response regulator RpfG family c-di-GMP phosphodiesterase
MLNKIKIYILDNDKRVRAAYHQQLSEQGYYNLVHCSHEEQLIRLIPYSNIDVVISDMNMPKFKARELVFKLKKSKENGKAKIIYTMGKDHDNIIRHIRADAFISKLDEFPRLYKILQKFENEQSVSESRVFKRFRYHSAIKIDPNSNAIDEVTDISLSGIGLESRFSFDLGSKLKVYVKSWGEKTFQGIYGKILWKDYGRLGYRYGLRFDNPVLPE